MFFEIDFISYLGGFRGQAGFVAHSNGKLSATGESGNIFSKNKY